MSDTAEDQEQQDFNNLPLSDPIFDPLFTTPQIVTHDDGTTSPLLGDDTGA